MSLNPSDPRLQLTDADRLSAAIGLHQRSEFGLDYNFFQDLINRLQQDHELQHRNRYNAQEIIENLPTPIENFEIKEGIGGRGLVASLSNGGGTTVTLRAAMDAQPLDGHHFQVGSLLAAADWFYSHRNASPRVWSGTINFVFQPDTETGNGAQRMVDDDLYNLGGHNIRGPDYILAQHIAPIPAGLVAIKSGPVTNCSESLRVTVYSNSRFARLSRTNASSASVASSIFRRLERLHTGPDSEVRLNENEIVNVDWNRGDRASNLRKAVLGIYISAANEVRRRQIVEGVTQVIEDERLQRGCRRSARVQRINKLPASHNNVIATTAIIEALRNQFGGLVRTDIPTSSGSDDLSVLANPVEAFCCMWFLGGVHESANEEGQETGTGTGRLIPQSIHPTFKTGIDAMIIAALAALKLPGRP